jgi:hypothetical protein
VGATLKRGRTLGGQAAARGTRASRPEAHHEPGESEVAEAHCPASPTPSPQKRAYLLGVPPAVGMVGPEDPRPKSLQSWRGLGLVMGFFLHHLRPLF